MSTLIVHEPDTPKSPSSELMKNEISACSSPPVNGLNDLHSSGSSSPITTPNLSFTPPANGLLTPPNDSDISDSTKPDHNAGRLKFYKNGILCLELGHNDVGEKRKWVQIKSKTVFPTVIHTKKEVCIPRHVSPTPPSFHLSNHFQQSSASHTSDDGSSMLSSPRVRESRKTVPHKELSSCLQFYFKPAKCIKKIRQENSLNLFRRPISTQQKITNVALLICHCALSSNPNSPKQETGETTTKKSKIKNSLGSIIEKLQSDIERIRIKSKPSPPPPQIIHQESYVELPKKRGHKKSSQEFSPPIRPSTKSSGSSGCRKTILNIPGFEGSSKREDEDFRNGIEIKKKKLSTESKSSPVKKEHTTSFHSSSHYPVNSAMCLASLPLVEQEKLFQQQTMSKAISYTINSLLSNPHSNNQESSSGTGRSNSFSSSSSSTEQKSKKGKKSSSSKNEIPSHLGGVDQNSFLRHLLDTSDPIPATKPEVSSTPKSSKQSPPPRQSSSNSNSNHQTTPTSSRSHQNHSNSTGKSKHSSSLEKKHQQQQPQPMAFHQQHPAMSYFPPAYQQLLAGGFPLSTMQAYESLLTSGGNPSSLVAAAAELQYQMQLQQQMLSLNPTLAAAYFGQQQQQQQHLANNRSPPGRPSKPANNSNSSSSGNSGNGSNLMNLSGYSIPVPFQAPEGTRRGSISKAHSNSSRERVGNKIQHDVVDNDLPLNLSKKPKPN